MGINIDLNTESLAFLNSSRFKTTECCKARTTALALPDRTFNSSSCLASLVNVTSRYLNFSVCFNNTLQTCRGHIGHVFSKDGVPQFCKYKFSFQQCHMQLQSHLMRIGSQIQRKPAKLNHLRKTAD